MKKVGVLIFFLVIVLLSPINIKAGEVTGKTVTGEATSGAMNISIFILPGNAPFLTISSPENKTYLYNTSILLDYTATNADNVWYSIDSQENITLTSSIYFNTSQGSHVLFLYANNSQGNASANVSFVTNSTRFIIYYDEYKSKGNTTNFTLYTYEDLQTLSDIILDNQEDGKILFLQTINMTNDLISDDNILDLDNNTNISFNRIELNSTSLPNFNVSATLWLYNLTFSNPRILRNGEVCPSSICTQESYNESSGILKFNVTSLALYSAEETPSAPTPTPSPGGGVAPVKKIDFLVEPSLIMVTLRQGKTFNTSIKLKNIGTLSQKFNIETILEDFIVIADKEFTLLPGKGKEIPLVFYASENKEPGTYTGKIRVYDNTGVKEIPVIIEVESKIVLFDLILSIPTKYKEVRPMGNVLLEISIFNLGTVEKADIKMKYQIKDFENNVIVEKEEMVEVETQVSFQTFLQLPKDIPDGEYVAVATGTYKESAETASDVFYVSRVKIKMNYIYIIITGIGILALIIIIIYYKRRKKRIAKIVRQKNV